MKNFLSLLGLIFIANLAMAQQNGPSMPSPNIDEASDYQGTEANEGNGTSFNSGRQAQEERAFNKNQDFSQVEEDEAYREETEDNVYDNEENMIED